MTDPTIELTTTDAHFDHASSAAGTGDELSCHNAFSQESPHSTGALVSPTFDRNHSLSYTPNSVDLQQNSGHIGYQQDPSISADKVFHQGSIQTKESSIQSFSAVDHCQAFEDVQEACLLRYFIEELSNWVRCQCLNGKAIADFAQV